MRRKSKEKKRFCAGRVAPEQIQKAIEAATQVEDEQKLYALNWSAPAELGSPKPRNPRHFETIEGGTTLRVRLHTCFAPVTFLTSSV